MDRDQAGLTRHPHVRCLSQLRDDDVCFHDWDSWRSLCARGYAAWPQQWDTEAHQKRYADAVARARQFDRFWEAFKGCATE